MENDFSLIKQLNNNESSLTLPKGIKYVEKTVTVGNKTITASIPLRESENFDKAISEHGKYLKYDDFKEILYNLRGIQHRG